MEGQSEKSEKVNRACTITFGCLKLCVQRQVLSATLELELHTFSSRDSSPVGRNVSATHECSTTNEVCRILNFQRFALTRVPEDFDDEEELEGIKYAPRVRVYAGAWHATSHESVNPVSWTPSAQQIRASCCEDRDSRVVSHSWSTLTSLASGRCSGLPARRQHEFNFVHSEK